MNWVKRLVSLTLGKRLPRHRGRLEMKGLHEVVDVRRDRYGIPYIDAVNAHDAWFALGFCHAQDRMGQLELSVRIIRGTLAEVAGKDALPIDRLVRRLGIASAGAAQFDVADADMQAQLTAYADGVNAALAATRRRSHEHALLGIRPTRWEPADPQRFATLLCFALAANWDIELARYEIARHHGIDALHALDPLVPEGLMVTSPPGRTAGAHATRFLEDARELGRVLGLGGGSNSWATAAAKTATGRPMLANDPHLNPQSPNAFYFARIKCPEFTAVGATFVGIPALAAGHNQHLAWGITAAHIDTTDLFVERVGPDGRSVEEDGQLVPCTVRREEIRVKGQTAPHVEEVLVTRRGPMLGPALDGAPDNLSIAATWLAPRPYRGLFGMHLARDVASARACFEKASTTNLALVLSEKPTPTHPAGRIAWLLATEVPVRKSGSGPLPQPGWDSRFGWDGLVTPGSLPALVDPPEGYIAAANNAPIVAGEGAAYLGIDFLDGYRATAISLALAGRGEWTRAAHQALQRDVRSLMWEEVKAVVLGSAPEEARQILTAWDGRMAADSPAAALFAFFVAEMSGRIIRAKAGHAYEMAMGKGATLLLPHNLLFARRPSHLARLLREQPAGWFEGESPEEAWRAEVRSGLEAALGSLRRRHGAQASDWAWGRVRPLRLLHPFGEKKPLARLFNLGPYPVGGDSTTIPQASLDLRNPSANAIGIPVYRMVIDVGAWDESRFALLGGQSGNPFSPNVDDQMEHWLTGEGVPIYCDDDARDRIVTAHQVLAPA